MKNNIKIEITYCDECGFLVDAMELAAAIESEFGIEAQLQEGHGGIFEVTLNNKLIYTNRDDIGRIPAANDVLKSIREEK